MWKRQVRDVLLRAHVGNLRVSAVVARDAVREAARRWQLPLGARATQLWAEYMAGTAMLGAFYKGDERVKLLLRSPAVQELYVEAMAVGEVRLARCYGRSAGANELCMCAGTRQSDRDESDDQGHRERC